MVRMVCCRNFPYEVKGRASAANRVRHAPAKPPARGAAGADTASPDRLAGEYRQVHRERTT